MADDTIIADFAKEIIDTVTDTAADVTAAATDTITTTTAFDIVISTVDGKYEGERELSI